MPLIYPFMDMFYSGYVGYAVCLILKFHYEMNRHKIKISEQNVMKLGNRQLQAKQR